MSEKITFYSETALSIGQTFRPKVDGKTVNALYQVTDAKIVGGKVQYEGEQISLSRKERRAKLAMERK